MAFLIGLFGASALSSMDLPGKAWEAIPPDLLQQCLSQTPRVKLLQDYLMTKIPTERAQQYLSQFSPEQLQTYVSQAFFSEVARQKVSIEQLQAYLMTKMPPELALQQLGLSSEQLQKTYVQTVPEEVRKYLEEKFSLETIEKATLEGVESLVKTRESDFVVVDAPEEVKPPQVLSRDEFISSVQALWVSNFFAKKQEQKELEPKWPILRYESG